MAGILKNTSNIKLSLFEQQVKKALKLYHEPQRLGEESPLASPYFLAQSLQVQAEPNARLWCGKTLCAEIRAAAATLWQAPLPSTLAEMQVALLEVRKLPGAPRYAYLVLELRCFQDYFKLERTADIWESETYLPGSQSQHYRDYDLAIVHLSKALLDRLHPSLRLETAPQPTELVGRQLELAQGIAVLRNRQSLNLSGAGGVGKTTLGAAIAGALAPLPLFWFTFRPTINDRLNSLLFALGYFLHQQDASELWNLIMATGAAIQDPYFALATVKQDLAQLGEKRPILCFDEIDRLGSLEETPAPPEHQQLLEFIESLQGQTTRLLIGQKTVLEADAHIELVGLTPPQLMALFLQQGVTLAKTEAELLEGQTAGNPRLLLLCLTLLQQGESIPQLLALLGRSARMTPVFYRLWQRLTAGERRFLQQLAVFPKPAPLQAEHGDCQALESLRHKRLVQLDGRGRVEVLPALRLPIYQEAPADLRHQLHLGAAQTYLHYGEYTDAAYHYVQARHFTEAIQVWHPHLQSEIQQGQAHAAFQIFSSLSAHGLAKADAYALAIIQAELYKLLGQFEKGLAQLAANDWHGQSPLKSQALALRGEFLELLGDPDAALAVYEQGVSNVMQGLSLASTLHQKRFFLHVRQRQMNLAQREVQLIECQYQLARGILADEAGCYADACYSFQQALALAEQADDCGYLALAERNLSSVWGRLQDWVNAETHAQRAIEHYRSLHDLVGVARVYDTLAFGYGQSKQLTKAVETGAKALQFFKMAQLPYYASIAATNLAENYFDLGCIETAQHYAHEVLAMEERHSFPYAFFTLGRIKRQQSDLVGAAAHFCESARIAQENSDFFLLAYAKRELGEIYGVTGKTPEAEGELSAALHFFEQAGMKEEAAATVLLCARFLPALKN